MTHALKSAIEALLEDETRISSKRQYLKEAYEEEQSTVTETSKRIDYLRDCLETGVSKREAARMLVVHDPRIGQKTAETLVYFNFSGQYQTTNRGRRKGTLPPQDRTKVLVVADVEDEEAIL